MYVYTYTRWSSFCTLSSLFILIPLKAMNKQYKNERMSERVGEWVRSCTISLKKHQQYITESFTAVWAHQNHSIRVVSRTSYSSFIYNTWIYAYYFQFKFAIEFDGINPNALIYRFDFEIRHTAYTYNHYHHHLHPMLPTSLSLLCLLISLPLLSHSIFRLYSIEYKEYTYIGNTRFSNVCLESFGLWVSYVLVCSFACVCVTIY